MKINLPQVNTNLVRFDTLKDGDAFFGRKGGLCFKAVDFGEANAMVCEGDGAFLSRYQDSDMVEPCDVEISVVRRKPCESSDLTLAEKELAKLEGGRITAMRCYKQRTGVGLTEAKRTVEYFLANPTD